MSESTTAAGNKPTAARAAPQPMRAPLLGSASRWVASLAFKWSRRSSTRYPLCQRALVPAVADD